MANIIVDIILVALLITGAIIGAVKGFVKTVAKPIKWVASLAFSFSVSPSLGDNVIKPLILTPVSNQLAEFLNERYAEITAENAGSSLPMLIRIAAGLCGININEVASNAENADISVLNAVINSITDPVVGVISVIIAFIILYIASSLVLSLVIAIINAIVDHGVVGVINRILGCILTLVLSFMIVWLLASVFDTVIAIPTVAEAAWVQEFTGGWVYNFLKSFSPLDLLLSF